MKDLIKIINILGCVLIIIGLILIIINIKYLGSNIMLSGIFIKLIFNSKIGDDKNE